MTKRNFKSKGKTQEKKRLGMQNKEAKLLCFQQDSYLMQIAF